tara:strand:+ start:220 stop:612 length:393 start_codon:yes stop_codon:yes gene_type:complete
MIDNIVTIYDKVTTDIEEHHDNIIFLSEIVNNCNYKIDQFININLRNKIINDYLLDKLPKELVNLIKEYNNEKLCGEEIRWILRKSDTINPFECFECSKLMKINFYHKNMCFWNYSKVYKEKFCENCKYV